MGKDTANTNHNTTALIQADTTNQTLTAIKGGQNLKTPSKSRPRLEGAPHAGGDGDGSE
jgi:hypothetical protein